MALLQKLWDCFPWCLTKKKVKIKKKEQPLPHQPCGEGKPRSCGATWWKAAGPHPGLSSRLWREERKFGKAGGCPGPNSSPGSWGSSPSHVLAHREGKRGIHPGREPQACYCVGRMETQVPPCHQGQLQEDCASQGSILATRRLGLLGDQRILGLLEGGYWILDLQEGRQTSSLLVSLGHSNIRKHQARNNKKLTVSLEMGVPVHIPYSLQHRKILANLPAVPE